MQVLSLKESANEIHASIGIRKARKPIKILMHIVTLATNNDARYKAPEIYNLDTGLIFIVIIIMRPFRQPPSRTAAWMLFTV